LSFSSQISTAISCFEVGNDVIQIGNWLVAETIGKGASGEVRKAIHQDTKVEAAIKIVHKKDLDAVEVERAKREAEIMKQLEHPHIVKLYDVMETADTLNIVMAYIPGDLHSQIIAKGGLSEQESKRIFLQLVAAVDYLHRRNIVHRDLKHKNILMDQDNNVKLADFGLSQFTQEGMLRSTFCGTPAYACPEMLLAKKYIGPEVDIWSLAVVLYTMLTAQFPFETVSELLIAQYNNPPNVSQECCDLLKIMLEVDPTKRATLEQVLEHPWCQQEL